MEMILTNVVAAVNDILWNKYLVLLFLLLWSVSYIMMGSHNPFIYFNF